MSSEHAATAAGARPIGTRHVPAVDPAAVPPLIRESIDVLLWFTTPTCVPCRELAPHLDEFARVHGDRVVVRAVDGHAAGPLTERFQVQGFPTLSLLHGGVRVWQHAGAFAGSAAEVAGVVLPLVARLESGRHAEADRSPRTPPPRPARDLVVPAAPRTSLQVDVVDAGERVPRRLDPGAHRVPAGASLVVTLTADHRADPPLDLDLLDQLPADCVDELVVVGHPVSLREIAAHPAARGVSTLVLWTGRTTATVEDLAAFPRLTVLETDDAWPAPVLPDVVVNGSWVLPELRSVLPGWTDEDHDEQLPLPELCDDDEPAAHGTAMLVFTTRESRLAQDVLAVVAEHAPDPGELPVLAVDSARCPVLAADHEVSAVPTLLLLRDGLQLWRSSSVFDAASFAELVGPVLAAAGRLDGRCLQRAAARPRRRLLLPSGPLPYLLHLQPPGLPASAATSLDDGGPVEVPAGWTTHVTIDLADAAFDWSALDAYGACDLDALHYLDWPGAREVFVAGLPTLARLVGLRTLELVSDCAPGLVGDLLPVLATLTELRVLTLEPASAAGDGPSGSQLLHLRAALPDTVVNGEWSGLSEHTLPRQRPAGAPPAAGGAGDDGGLEP